MKGDEQRRPRHRASTGKIRSCSKTNLTTMSARSPHGARLRHATSSCRGSCSPTATRPSILEIMREMGALGLLGPTIPDAYGGAGVNYVCYGLAAREIECVDSGYRSAMSVQSSLVMFPDPHLRHRGPAADLPAQPRHRRADRLLRPDRARPWLRPGRHADESRARARRLCPFRAPRPGSPTRPIADVMVVWAKLDGVIRGFILERGMDGL